MATEQKQSAQQPPEDEQPKRRRGRATGTQKAADDQTATEKTAKTSRAQGSTDDDSPKSGGASRNNAPRKAKDDEAGGSSGADESAPEELPGSAELGHLLQEQINLAIQPVLQDFRRQVASAVQQEVEQASTQVHLGDVPAGQSHGDGSNGDQAPTDTDRATKKQEAAPEKESAGQTDAAPAQSQGTDSPTPAESQAKEPAQAKSREADAESSSTSEETKNDGDSESGDTRGLTKGGVRPAMESAVGLVERQAENLLQALLTAGANALLADSTRSAVQRGAESGIHAALEKAAGATSGNATVRELRAQTETTLVAILQETLDAIYADSLRTRVQSEAGGASRELLHGNVGGAVGHLGEVVQILAQELMGVLRHQWHRLLRLLLKVVLAALDDSSHTDRPKLSDSAGERGTSGDA